MTFTLKCNKRKYHILQVRCGIPKCSSFTSSLHTPVRAKQNKVQLHQNGAASSLSHTHAHARTHFLPSCAMVNHTYAKQLHLGFDKCNTHRD